MFSLLSIFFLIDVSSVGNKDVLLNRYISLVTKIKTPSKVVIFKKTKTYRQRLLFAERGKFFLDNKKIIIILMVLLFLATLFVYFG